MFLCRVAKCLTKYNAVKDAKPLDSDANGILQDKNGLALSFEGDAVLVGGRLHLTSALRRTTVVERLCRRMSTVFPLYEPGAAEKEAAELVAGGLLQFYKGGGKYLDEENPDAALEVWRQQVVVNTERVMAAKPNGYFAYQHGVLASEPMGSLDQHFFVMRFHSRVITGHRQFVEMLALTGPPSGAKSTLTVPVVKCLGNEGHARYVEEPPNNYLCVLDRTDANASRPTEFEYSGARLLHIKECPGIDMQHDACKRVLEMREGNLSSRANHSRPGDSVSIPITWAVMMSRQSNVTWPRNARETGMKSKVLEIRPPYEYLGPDEIDAENPRHKLARDSVIQEHSVGVHSAEVIFWARLLYPTLTLVDNRHMLPRPKCLEVFEGQAATGGTKAAIEVFIETYLTTSTTKEATETAMIDKLVTEILGDHDRSVLLTFGIGNSVRMRRGGKQSVSRYYKVRFASGLAPAVLKGASSASGSV